MWWRLRGQPVVWDTVTTTIYSTIGRGTGLLVPFFVAAWFGTSSETDAFFFAYGLVLFLSTMFAPVVESVVVPYVAEIRATGKSVGPFLRGVLVFSGAGVVVATGGLLLLARPVLALVTHFDRHSLDLTLRLLAEAAPLVLLLVWTSVQCGVLNAYKKFAVPALSPAFRALIILGFVFAFKGQMGVHSIALGYVVAECCRLLLLGVLTQPMGVLSLGSARSAFRLERGLAKFLKTASYQIIGMTAVSLGPMVDKVMGSWLGKGSISLLEYSDRLYTIPYVFVSSGLMVTLLSFWSETHYERGIEEFRQEAAEAQKRVILIVAGLTALLVVLEEPTARLLLWHGSFKREDLAVVQVLYGILLFGLPWRVLSVVQTRICIVLKRTDEITRLGVLMLGLKVVGNLILMRPFGLYGIAVSTLTAQVLCYIFLNVRLRRHFWQAAKLGMKIEDHDQ